MSIKILKKGKKISEKDIQKLEDIIGFKLPADYRKFLLVNNGGEPEPNEFDIPGENNSSGVNEFLNVEEIKKQKKKLGNRLVDSSWPIAYAEGGNLVCITVGKKEGAIYFWDHELEASDNELPSWTNMFLLTSKFSKFWNSLKKIDPSKIKIKPEQIKNTWIDPSLLKK